MLSNEHALVVQMVGYEARNLANETGDYVDAKRGKDAAENEIMAAIVEAVRPALPSISSRIAGMSGPLKRGVNLCSTFYIGEQGDFFSLEGGKVRCLTIEDVLEETSLPAVLAVFFAAMRAQAGRLSEKTIEIRREANILDGIATALRVGGVR